MTAEQPKPVPQNISEHKAIDQDQSQTTNENNQIGLGSFDNLKDFVAEAARAGIHHTIPQKTNQSTQQWANQWNALGIYAFTDASHGDIVAVYGLTRENWRNLVMRATQRLHAASPPELQAAYPLESLSFRKPRTAKARLKMMHPANIGLYQTIQASLEEGKSMREIQKELGISGNQLSKLRTSSRFLGEELPYVHKVARAETEQSFQLLLDPSTPRDTKQQILQTITRGYLEKYREDPNAPFTLLSHIAKQAGIKLQKDELYSLAAFLKEQNVPVNIIEYRFRNRVMRYGVIAGTDKEAVTNMLGPDSAFHLRDRAVRLVAGASESIPSTYMILKSGEFQSVRDALGERISRELKRRKLTIQTALGADCPVAVFTYSSRSYIRNEDAERLYRYFVDTLGVSPQKPLPQAGTVYEIVQTPTYRNIKIVAKSQVGSEE